MNIPGVPNGSGNGVCGVQFDSMGRGLSLISPLVINWLVILEYELILQIVLSGYGFLTCAKVIDLNTQSKL